MDSPLSEVITIIDTFPAFPPAKDLREQIITVILPSHPLTTVTTVHSLVASHKMSVQKHGSKLLACLLLEELDIKWSHMPTSGLQVLSPEKEKSTVLKPKRVSPSLESF